MSALTEKLENLKRTLTGMQSLLVAYSGGVDSTFLLKVACSTLGQRVLAVTARSETYPPEELSQARVLARKLGARHRVISTYELAHPNFTANPLNRCYYCKTELFSRLRQVAQKNGLNYVADGTNFDDLKDFRPGMRAKIKFGVRSPLMEAKLTKQDIRCLSKGLGLSTFDKPALACLASRIPYGTRITKENLIRVNRAEGFMRNLGMPQVRVRDYGSMARIEVAKEQIPKLLKRDLRMKIIYKFKRLGYNYITLDLEGYRTGSMNPPGVTAQGGLKGENYGRFL